MEFGIEKCIVLITEGTELPIQEKNIRSFGEKENYQYFGILEADIIKQEEMKEKNRKRVPQTNEKNP